MDNVPISPQIKEAASAYKHKPTEELALLQDFMACVFSAVLHVHVRTEAQHISNTTSGASGKPLIAPCVPKNAFKQNF